MHSYDRSPQAAFIDDNSAAAIDEAVAALTANRAPTWAGDLSLELHVLASLRAQVDADLTSAVGQAHAAGFEWSYIAELLDITADQARRHYEAPRPRKEPAYRPRSSYHAS